MSAAHGLHLAWATPWAAILLLTIMAAMLYLGARARGARRAEPRGALVYRDADGRGQPLRSPLRPLSGKPDYVIRTRRGDHVPIELKSYRGGAYPPHPDVVQLGAYLLLLEDLHGRRPPYGVLRYTDRAVRVPYSASLRAEVLRLLERIQRDEAPPAGTPPAGTPHPALCRACPFAPMCEMARS